jgi:hypothetical protein
MEDKKTPEKGKGKINVDSLMSYASHWSLRFAGSILVLSFAVNNVSQLDDIADAYAKVIVLEAESKIKTCPATVEPVAIPKELIERIEKLEAVSHTPTGK